MTLIFHSLISASLVWLADVAFCSLFALLHFYGLSLNPFGDVTFWWSFVLACFLAIQIYPCYQNFIESILFKLFPDVFEDSEDEETDADDDDEYDLPNTFKAVYNNEKINAYFQLVSPKLCGCYQLLLLKNIDRTCGEYLEIIGIKPPFKVKRNEIVIQQPDPFVVEYLDRNYDNGMFSFVHFVADENSHYYVYKVNFSKIKPYIYDTICDKELYMDIKESLISSAIDELTTDNGDK